MASRRAQRRNQTSSTGTSDAVLPDRAGRAIPRLRRQVITLGVMVAVSTFINIVLYRLVCQYNIHARQGSLPGQTCPRVRIGPGTEDSSSWKDLQPHLRETLCLHRALVSLDLDTASPALSIYSKERSVTWTDGVRPPPHSPKAFEHCSCVLGRGVFTSGRHYWEVGVQVWLESEEREIRQRVVFAIGVARDSVERKKDIVVSPEEGFWAVQRLGDGHYYPTNSPLTRLSLRQRPLKLGLYLDYDGGLMSFYNADTWEHLYTFNDTFRGVLHPFFQVEDPRIILHLV